jgi:hypothetical protein
MPSVAELVRDCFYATLAMHVAASVRGVPIDPVRVMLEAVCLAAIGVTMTWLNH